jgi:hypothetical protein
VNLRGSDGMSIADQNDLARIAQVNCALCGSVRDQRR